MSRVPFEIVALEVNHILEKMAEAPSWEFYYYRSKYLHTIQSFGWTDYEYDNESLKRIDSSWEIFFNYSLN